MNDDEDLKPCPCCGSGAYFYMVESDGLIDGRAGGWFVECNNSECRLTTQLMFATGDDPRPRLREIWNKRHNPRSAPRREDGPHRNVEHHLRQEGSHAVNNPPPPLKR